VAVAVEVRDGYDMRISSAAVTGDLLENPMSVPDENRDIGHFIIRDRDIRHSVSVEIRNGQRIRRLTSRVVARRLKHPTGSAIRDRLTKGGRGTTAILPVT
jgi:hypothetical protein